MSDFAIIGVAGYIAPRHLQAIRDTGNNVVISMDPYDAVGRLDVYGFYNSSYFNDFAMFEREVDNLKYDGNPVHYLSVCSPNYLHDAHIRFGLKSGMNVICEKPILINPEHFDVLVQRENESGKKVNSILQLRLHPSIKELKSKIDNGPKNHIYNIELDYITSRGIWYQHAWKGDKSKSGGLVMNIGVHFFDMLIWIFGSVQKFSINNNNEKVVSGNLLLEKANVSWLLSIDKNNLPDSCKKTNKYTYRKIIIDGQEIEFSEGFTDLHTQSYQEILNGNGFTLQDALPSIDLVYRIRKSK